MNMAAAAFPSTKHIPRKVKTNCLCKHPTSMRCDLADLDIYLKQFRKCLLLYRKLHYVQLQFDMSLF